MARVVWKGAIVFGLVHVPVDLYAGAKDQGLDFDWIDKRDMAPVGYQRVNKVTGEPIEAEHVVKGYEIERGHYVVLRDEDFAAANPKATQTVEILAFVDAAAIAPQFYEKPYRLVPGKRGEKGDASIPYVRVRNLKELVASVQGGTIEFHEWGATLPRIDRPDRITLDLDPDPALPWPTFREACELARALLDELDLAWFVKTTGGKGLHFVLPIVRRDGWDEVKDFAQRIAEHLAGTLPSLFVATMSKAKRRGRVFVDYLRNGETATAVAAYSLRSRPGLPVAMPIAWDELDQDVRGDFFNVRNVPELLGEREDPWAGYARAAQSIARARRRLGR